MNKKQSHNFISAVCKRAASKNINASFALHTEKSHLMRIGNNSVSLNTSETLTRLDIEVINGKKTASHTQMGEVISEEYVEKALQIAADKALAADEKSYQPILPKIEKEISEKKQYDPELEGLNPEFKAEGYKKVIEGAGSQYNFSGSWSSGSTEIFLTSTANNLCAYHIGTDQDFNVVLKHPQKKWELRQAQCGYKKSDFNAEEVVASFKNLLYVYENSEPEKIIPGEYTVVFGAQAIAEILQMAVFTGFEGRSYEEKDSWTAHNKLGDLILNEKVTLLDDATNDKTFSMGFAMSGQERKCFEFTKNGKFCGIMYDLDTAAKYNKTPTPHLGQEVCPFSLVMGTGEGDKDACKAVKGMGKVLWVPAMHYLGLPSASQGIFTGSSRFNAVLIENGRVTRPIYSVRITDSFQNLFGKNLKIISSASQAVNLSLTYGRRTPEAYCMPSYIVSEKVKITDSSDSF